MQHEVTEPGIVKRQVTDVSRVLAALHPTEERSLREVMRLSGIGNRETARAALRSLRLAGKAKRGQKVGKAMLWKLGAEPPGGVAARPVVQRYSIDWPPGFVPQIKFSRDGRMLAGGRQL